MLLNKNKKKNIVTPNPHEDQAVMPNPQVPHFLLTL
jgi:hypothetical protein